MPSASPAERKREAVQAWLRWRSARAAAVATANDKPAADPLRVMLGQWWDSEKMPKVEKASPAQLDRALEQITRLEYGERPF